MPLELGETTTEGGWPRECGDGGMLADTYVDGDRTYITTELRESFDMVEEQIKNCRGSDGTTTNNGGHCIGGSGSPARKNI